MLAFVWGSDLQSLWREMPVLGLLSVIELQENLAHDMDAMICSPGTAPRQADWNATVEDEVGDAFAAVCCNAFAAQFLSLAKSFDAYTLFRR